MNEGTLYLIGTPIGNLDDISLRAQKMLGQVEILLCEDTRQTHKLLDLLHVSPKPRLERFDENVERIKTHKVIAWLTEGKQVGLVTDAGMPGISDPGMFLVQACYAASISVDVIPGPSALTAAIALAGLPASQTLFLGFLPKKEGKRREIFDKLRVSSDGLQVVIYESPYRLKQTLTEISEFLGDVEIAAMGELTKLHQKIIRGNVSQIIASLPETLKGEWVIVMRI